MLAKPKWRVLIFDALMAVCFVDVLFLFILKFGHYCFDNTEGDFYFAACLATGYSGTIVWFTVYRFDARAIIGRWVVAGLTALFLWEAIFPKLH